VLKRKHHWRVSLIKNIRLVRSNIDVSKILAEINKYPSDWDMQKKLENADQNHELQVSVLQLVIGAVKEAGEHPKDSELSVKTPIYKKYTETRRWLRKNGCANFHRLAFLKLAIGNSVGTHIDEGSYYLTRDRYHLSIQGEYKYKVGDQEVIIKPGTFFWFNNKVPHGTLNVGNEPRITMVFDLPHSASNP